MQHPVLAHRDPEPDVPEVERLLEECVKVRVGVPVPLLGKPSLLVHISKLPNLVHRELPNIDQKHGPVPVPRLALWLAVWLLGLSCCI